MRARKKRARVNADIRARARTQRAGRSALKAMSRDGTEKNRGDGR